MNEKKTRTIDHYNDLNMSREWRDCFQTIPVLTFLWYQRHKEDWQSTQDRFQANIL